MTRLEEVERLLEKMSDSEKVQLLQRVARELGENFPGIEKDPRVSGGEPCIVRTRIPVWIIEQSRRLGASEADILKSYPNLRREDLTNASIFAQAHPQDIDRQIQENETA
jgi:uncharacterized protein (DUF433 family)